MDQGRIQERHINRSYSNRIYSTCRTTRTRIGKSFSSQTPHLHLLGSLHTENLTGGHEEELEFPYQPVLPPTNTPKFHAGTLKTEGVAGRTERSSRRTRPQWRASMAPAPPFPRRPPPAASLKPSPPPSQSPLHESPWLALANPLEFLSPTSGHHLPLLNVGFLFLCAEKGRTTDTVKKVNGSGFYKAQGRKPQSLTLLSYGNSGPAEFPERAWHTLVISCSAYLFCLVIIYLFIYLLQRSIYLFLNNYV